MTCCGRKPPRQVQPSHERSEPGAAPSADSFLAASKPRYEVVARRTDATGKRFSTLTAAQDHARRTGGVIRQL